jgi:hypothetical protein
MQDQEIIWPTWLKTCSRCGETKETREFYNDCTRADGISHWCKACKSAVDLAWYDTKSVSVVEDCVEVYNVGKRLSIH